MSIDDTSPFELVPGTDQEVLEAEVVKVEMDERSKAVVRYQGYGRQLSAVGRVVTHDRTKAAGRNLYYPALGVKTLVENRRDAKGVGRHEKAMTAAEQAMAIALAQGDLDKAAKWDKILKEWNSAKVAAEEKRDDRRAKRPETAKGWAKAAFIALGGLAALLLTVGIVLAINGHDAALVWAPISAIIRAVAWTYVFLSVYGALLLIGGTVTGLLVLWHVGRDRDARDKAPAPMPEPEPRYRPAEPSYQPALTGTYETYGDGDSGSDFYPVEDAEDGRATPQALVAAFHDLRIPRLEKAMDAMSDGGMSMVRSFREIGRGVEADVQLPKAVGVSTADVLERHRLLAGELDRAEHYLFSSVSPDVARAVRLLILDQGAMDGPVGPSPMLTGHGYVANYFTGAVPLGEDARGDEVELPLYQRHLLVVGQTNYGKSTTLREIELWLAQDPDVEHRVADLKGGDWAMFEELATEYVAGPTEGDVIEATHMIERAVDEMNKRYAVKKTKYPAGITEKIAREPGSGFHPLIVVVDEGQKGIRSRSVEETTDWESGKVRTGDRYGGYGGDSKFYRACQQIEDQGRAVNVLLHYATQNPDNRNFPTDLRDQAAIRISTALARKEQATMALGDEAVDAGAAPHKLGSAPKGTVLIAGPGVDTKGDPAIICRVHPLYAEDANMLAAGAIELRASSRASRSNPASGGRDVLADVASLLEIDEGWVKIAGLRDLLAERYPGTYDSLTQKDLTANLQEARVPVSPHRGYPRLRAENVRTVLEARGGETHGTGA